MNHIDVTVKKMHVYLYLYTRFDEKVYVASRGRVSIPSLSVLVRGEKNVESG